MIQNDKRFPFRNYSAIRRFMFDKVEIEKTFFKSFNHGIH